MNQKLNFAYTFLEVLCIPLVIFGFGQFFDGASLWQFQLMTNWTSIGLFCATIILISAAISIPWHRKDPERISIVHNWLQTIISFYLVYMICGYAFAKILKTQFQPPSYVLETPIGELSGFWLTWTYYGFSETFADILGWTQIIGCLLLLFRKTRLLGVFVLIPVMVNIDLIDHFYSISPLAYYNALHYTFMLFFLLSLDTDKLIKLFFSFEDRLKHTDWKFWALNVIRVLVVGLAFMKIYDLRESFQPKTRINGVWKVSKVYKAGRDMMPEYNPDSVWSKIYFEWRYGCLMKLDPKHSKSVQDQRGAYTVNEDASQIKINLQPASPEQKGDSLLLHYTFLKDSSLHLVGFYNRDSVKMELVKLK